MCVAATGLATVDSCMACMIDKLLEGYVYVSSRSSDTYVTFGFSVA